MRLFSVDFMGAALAGSALLLNNPAGHTLLQEVGLRIAFHDALLHARQVMGKDDLSFSEFRDIAPIALANYYPDIETYKEAVTTLANGTTPFCAPLQTDPNKAPQSPTDQAQACHAVCNRDDEDCDDEGDNWRPDEPPKP